MPVTLVSILEGRTAKGKRELMEAVQGAIAAVLKLPAHDRNLRLAEFNEGEWLLPEGAGPLYTLVETALFAGRTAETKGALYAAIVEALGKLGVPARDVFIRVIEQPRENFGIRGGQRADLVALGYEVQV